ncbi:MAG: hypothetical protein WBA46_17750 [Thermomicrobiales bacterium]
MISPTATANPYFFGFDGDASTIIREAGLYLYPESMTEDLLSTSLRDLIITQPQATLDAFGIRVTAVEGRQDAVDAAIVGFDAHLLNTANPHAVTKAQVGLDQVDNTSDLDKPISNATVSTLGLFSTAINNHTNASTAVHGVTGSVVGTSGSQSLSSKRIIPRVTGTTSNTTLTPAGDLSDQYGVTALATNATIAAPSGTPNSGQMLVLSIKDDGVSRTLTWDPIYITFARALPLATGDVGGNFYAFFRYNGALAKWILVHLAAANGASASWGQIGGSLGSQTDLIAALGSKANTAHVHDGADVTTGTVGIARLPTGANSSTLATGDRGMPTGGTTGQVLAKTSGTNYATQWVGGYTTPTPVVVNDSTNATYSSGTVDLITSGIVLPGGGNWLVRAEGWLRAEGGVAGLSAFLLGILIDGVASTTPNLGVEQGVDAQNGVAFARVLTGAGVNVPVILRMTWVTGTITRYTCRLMITAVPA